jgi:hypothetical protein
MAYALEGLGTTITLGSSSLCLVSIAGLGIDGGEKLPATCLDNSDWMTYLPQTLVDVPNLSFTAAYDPSEFAALVAEVNVNQQITINFAAPLGSITFWGFLKSLTPGEGTYGSRWEATGEISCTNMNASNVETGPVYS